jgi:uncharacterized protein YjaG (DUF416 family)
MTVNIGKTEFNKNFPFIEWLTELPDLLIGLVRRKRLLFLAACCERQFGNYAQFHQETGWGDPQVLCDGLQSLWNYTDNIDITNLKNIRRAIEAVTPDTEEFKSGYTSSALNAATALLESLDYCVDDDISHCLQVACLCRDSIYMFIQLREDYDYSDDDETKIYVDPLMARELQAQQSDIELLKSLSDGANSTIPFRNHKCDPDSGSLSE